MVTAPEPEFTVMPAVNRSLLAAVPDTPPRIVVAPEALKLRVAKMAEVPRFPFRKTVELDAAPGVVLKIKVSETVANGAAVGSINPAKSVDHFVKSFQFPELPSQ